MSNEWVAGDSHVMRCQHSRDDDRAAVAESDSWTSALRDHSVSDWAAAAGRQVPDKMTGPPSAGLFGGSSSEVEQTADDRRSSTVRRHLAPASWTAAARRLPDTTTTGPPPPASGLFVGRPGEVEQAGDDPQSSTSSWTAAAAAGRRRAGDVKYWERRRKNNEAAKRSRDVRRANERRVALQAALLERENARLRCAVGLLTDDTLRLHYYLLCSRAAAASGCHGHAHHRRRDSE